MNANQKNKNEIISVYSRAFAVDNRKDVERP